ncbi:MAG: hypothetical protein ACYTEL_17655 [Planctomycetota bacterium]
MKEMSERLLKNPEDVPTSETAHIALMFSNIAWNETVGLVHPRNGYRSSWEMIEAENPQIWSEFKSNNVDAMIDELVQFKKQHYPDDQRRILACGIEKTPSATPSALPARQVQDAILQAFPYEGDLRVRHLWSTNGITHYRANWYRQVDGETTITRSLFLHVTKTSDGLVVQDETVI